MDMLFLEGLEVPCRVGCTPEERATPQSLRVAVQLHCDNLQRAGETDDLAATVDYRVATDMIAASPRSWRKSRCVTPRSPKFASPYASARPCRGWRLPGYRLPAAAHEGL